MTSQTPTTREGFLIVLVPDRDCRERHQGTLQSARQRAIEWLRTYNVGPTADELGQQRAAEIYRLADHPGQTYGQIIASQAYCDVARQD